MPTADRRPRRRIHSTRWPDFRSEREAREAAAEVRALPEGPERDAAWQSLRPRLERWVLSIARTSVTREQAAGIALIYLRRPMLLPMLPPS